jgi:hypothetical protein
MVKLITDLAAKCKAMAMEPTILSGGQMSSCDNTKRY